ncbi:MAG: hypothetical protein OEZ20_08425 [candidate division WOR-3 bacterium]|nr:hypothetical protein [candidate division WOR-3 bacterium]MDH5684473.1 hypothetical protein [candidate division WOR-3 bacterium]
MNKYLPPLLILVVLFAFVPVFPQEMHYYYISSASNPDFKELEGAVCILETDQPLEPILPGFAPTTIEEIHAMGYFTPTEARAKAQCCNPPADEPYGSFCYCWIGKEPPDPNRGRGGPVPEPDKKYVEIGGWTRAKPGDNQIGLKGETYRNGELTHWFPDSHTYWIVPAQYPDEIRYVYATHYKLEYTYSWYQHSWHKWWPGLEETDSGANCTH